MDYCYIMRSDDGIFFLSSIFARILWGVQSGSAVLLLGVNTDSIDFDRQIEQTAGKNLASFADLVTIAKQMELHLQGMSMTFEPTSNA